MADILCDQLYGNAEGLHDGWLPTYHVVEGRFNRSNA